MTEKVKKTLKDLVLYPIAAAGISAAAAVVLLCLVYLLPTKNIEKNVVRDFDIFYMHSEYGEHFITNPNNIVLSTIDDYSDLLMMSNCFARQPGDPFYKAALRGTYIGRLTDPNDLLHGYNPVQGMIYYVLTGSNYEFADYSRYWNGYQVILIPLLSLMPYSLIIILNKILLVITAAAAVLLISRRFGKIYGIAYAAAIFTIYPFVIPICLQYCASAYVTLISTIAFCLIKNEEHIPKLFLFSGIVVSFLDLLSYPALSAGILSVLFIIAFIGKKDNISIIKSLFICLIFWGFGYGAMFLSKWLLDALILGPQELKNALATARFRIDGANYSFGYLLNILKALLVRSATRDVLILTAVFTLVCLIAASTHKGNRKYKLSQLWLFILPPAVIFGWFAVMKNHTIQHTFFSIRNFSVMWFSIYAFAASLTQKKEETKEAKETNETKNV